MVRNSALLVVICSATAFSIQNMIAFDKEVEKKAAKFLEQKKNKQNFKSAALSWRVP